MALKRYDLNIGKRMESIELPEEHVVQVIDGGSVSKITDIKHKAESNACLRHI